MTKCHPVSFLLSWNVYLPLPFLIGTTGGKDTGWSGFKACRGTGAKLSSERWRRGWINCNINMLLRVDYSSHPPLTAVVHEGHSNVKWLSCLIREMEACVLFLRSKKLFTMLTHRRSLWFPAWVEVHSSKAALSAFCSAPINPLKKLKPLFSETQKNAAVSVATFLERRPWDLSSTQFSGPPASLLPHPPL